MKSTVYALGSTPPGNETAISVISLSLADFYAYKLKATFSIGNH